MRRILPYFSVALAVSVLMIAGCDAEPDPRPDAASGSAPSIPSSSPAPTTTESSPAPPAAASPAAQDALDEQLRQAAWNNDVALATELIGAGADVNAKDTATESAYLIATSEGYLDLLNLTLAHGAAIDDKDSWNGTGLIRASERGHALVVGRLLQAGIAPDHVNRIGYQAIHEAIWLGEDTPEYRDTLRVLIAGGVELTRPSSREALTPLQMATQRNYPGIEATLRTALDPVEIADPNATLLAAAGSGDPEQAAMALRAGADIEARDSNQRTPLLLAATNDNVDVARLLVALGADPDALDDRHDTPWLVTGVTGSVAMLEALLPAAPDQTILNRFGGTSLIPASERGHVAYVQRVLQTDVDVNHVNRLGWTGLLEAVILGDGGTAHQQIVSLLLTAGADPGIPDKDGVTALEHAQSRGHTAIASLLAAG